MTAGFPNLFMMTGPGSPSVLANMITGVEQHAEYINEMLQAMRRASLTEVQPLADAEDEWVGVVNMRSQATLYPQCNSWYLGANVPGKPRVFMPYIAGMPAYRRKCEAVAAAGYTGFALDGSHGTA